MTAPVQENKKYYVKAMIQAEIIPEDRIFTVDIAGMKDKFVDEVREHFENPKVVTASGVHINPLVVTSIGTTRRALRITDTERFPEYKKDANGELTLVMCTAKVGVVFDTDQYDDAMYLMNTMANNKDLMQHAGLAWKWYDPESLD